MRHIHPNTNGELSLWNSMVAGATRENHPGLSYLGRSHFTGSSSSSQGYMGIIWDYTIQYNENITIHEGISSNISTKGTTQGFEHCSSDKDVWYFLFDKDVWHFMFGKKHEVPSGYLYIYTFKYSQETP